MDAKKPATGRSSASSISNTLRVCETFLSLSGESTRQGRPAWFIRLGGCNLRCAWCDTSYAWAEGEPRRISELADEAAASGAELAVVTGGEPLLQRGVNLLISALDERGLTILVETNGTQFLGDLDPVAIRIVDVKPPSAEAGEPFLMRNLDHVRSQDELKFPVADRQDFDFALDFVTRHRLGERCALLLSPVAGRVDPAEVAEWMLEAGAGFRLQLQLHKILWGEDVKGR
ncbi:MAG: radical SAM protein [Candidatus Lernaella stagnicola]|nr:radical SAM protein [Candidatus Lernaella stagnicola]